MVIDVGAGTTDFGVFLLQHNPDKEVCLTRIILGTIEYLPEAGNRVDDLFKFYVLNSEGIDPAVLRVEETYPQFAPQYPQLAVAIGGAAPDLPEQGAIFADFKGLGARTYA